MEQKERRYDIDWVRVLAFYLLIFFHTGMLFVPWDFHIKNNVTSEWFEVWMAFLGYWRLPLLFLISGVGVYYALGKRTKTEFIKERSKRLLLPLIFGMLIIVPPQIYIERIVNGAEFANYFDFWKTIFEFVPYPDGGSLSWHHLWFVTYLFFYSLLMLPLFKYLKSEKSVGFRNAVSNAVKKYPYLIYSLIIPVFILRYTLGRMFPVTHAFWGDWYMLSFSLVFFIYGFMITSVNSIWDTITSLRKTSLILAAIPSLFLMLFVWGPTFYIMNEDTAAFGNLYDFLVSLMIASMLPAILGYAKVYLNRQNKFIVYANESVYPLYIVHQTVELILAYFLINLDINLVIKFFIVVIGTFGVSFLIYEFIIRRVNILRILFGMRKTVK